MRKVLQIRRADGETRTPDPFITRETPPRANRNQQVSGTHKTPARTGVLLLGVHGGLWLVAAGVCLLRALDGRCAYCGQVCAGRVCADCDHLLALDPLAPR